MPHRLSTLLLLLVALLLTACAVPATAPTASLDAPPVDRPAPPMSKPLPPERVEDATPASGPVALDRSCRTDADCTVKNVGNCCGMMPSCVNRNSPTSPEAVQAECAKKGIVSACGFQPVESCSCTAGTCTDKRALVN